MQYFNVTQSEIDQQLFNVFVGISLGNKLLTPELVEHYVEWAHKATNDDALILIADEIDAVNWEVFRGFSHVEAAEKVRQKGYNVLGMFEKAKRNLYKRENDPTYITKVHTIFWEDIKNDGYAELRNILFIEYQTNESFRDQVLSFVDTYIQLRDTDVSPEDRERLSGYIIDELPTLLGGILWNNKLYNLMLYPTYVDSGMSQFVLDIRAGKYFDAAKLQLRQICVLVEDYLVKPEV